MLSSRCCSFITNIASRYCIYYIFYYMENWSDTSKIEAGTILWCMVLLWFQGDFLWPYSCILVDVLIELEMGLICKPDLNCRIFFQRIQKWTIEDSSLFTALRLATSLFKEAACIPTRIRLCCTWHRARKRIFLQSFYCTFKLRFSGLWCSVVLW
jgi:hypothetical protein